eukprot:14861586-Alexandrium_andersonii.AAC.1
MEGAPGVGLNPCVSHLRTKLQSPSAAPRFYSRAGPSPAARPGPCPVGDSGRPRRLWACFRERRLVLPRRFRPPAEALG